MANSSSLDGLETLIFSKLDWKSKQPNEDLWDREWKRKPQIRRDLRVFLFRSKWIHIYVSLIFTWEQQQLADRAIFDCRWLYSLFSLSALKAASFHHLLLRERESLLIFDFFSWLAKRPTFSQLTCSRDSFYSFAVGSNQTDYSARFS